MRRFLPSEPLRLANWADVPATLRGIVEEGWTVDARGAYLLKRLAAGYHGSRAAFNDTGYEASVNGLGIPNWGIADLPGYREILLRRSVSFGCYALRAAKGLEGAENLNAVISMSVDTRVTSRVTFFLERLAEPYLREDIESYRNESVLIFTRSDVDDGNPGSRPPRP